MHDLRLALRNLLRRPGFTAVAVATLALGIGANTAVFTVFHAVLLAPLPYDRPAEVVMLNEQMPQFGMLSVTRYNYDEWRKRAKSFSGMAAFRPTNLTVSGVGEPERVPAKMLSADLLPMLGVRIEHGRDVQRGGRPSGGGRRRAGELGLCRAQVPGRRGARPHDSARPAAAHHRRDPAATVRAVPAGRRLRAVRAVGGDAARGSRLAPRHLSDGAAQGRRVARGRAGRDGRDRAAARGGVPRVEQRTSARWSRARRISWCRTSGRR